MGFFDKIGSMLGSDKSAKAETVKGPSRTLRDNGIDPSNLKFSFNQDGSLGVSGHAGSQSECDRICEVLEGIPNVSNVQNNIIIGAAEPMPDAVGTTADVVAEEVVTEEVVVDAPEAAGRTYTVKSGDTLWAISQEMYGSGGKYMKIFEANSDLLENPDKIFPGQELVIPDID